MVDATAADASEEVAGPEQGRGQSPKEYRQTVRLRPEAASACGAALRPSGVGVRLGLEAERHRRGVANYDAPIDTVPASERAPAP